MKSMYGVVISLVILALGVLSHDEPGHAPNGSPPQ